MEILNLSNYFNHHQKPLADELHKLIGDGYHFVETATIREERMRLGYQALTAPYILKYNDESKNKIEQMIMDADVVIYGEAPLSLIRKRYQTNKLTFRDQESRYKHINRYLKWPIYTYQSTFINKGYLLCASAYAPIDHMLSGMNPRKCFRWGYFTEVIKYDIDTLMEKKRTKNTQIVSILWVGRLIKLKHPETIIKVAKRLSCKNITFRIDVVGTGKLENTIKQDVKRQGLDNVIHFHGAMPPTEVRKHMEDSDIFIFTSDRQEGWGAVLNESMNSGCAVVADGNIGSVPYLIEDGKNGLIFKSKDYDDLCNKVEYLAKNPKIRKDLGINAYKTMIETWNAEVAAKNFINLCQAIVNNQPTPIETGPCSQAPLLMRTWRGKFHIL